MSSKAELPASPCRCDQSPERPQGLLVTGPEQSKPERRPRQSSFSTAEIQTHTPPTHLQATSWACRPPTSGLDPSCFCHIWDGREGVKITSPISQGWSLTVGRVGEGEGCSWISHRSSFGRNLPKSQFPLPVTGMLSLLRPQPTIPLSPCLPPGTAPRQ